MRSVTPQPRVAAGIALMLIATAVGALTVQHATARVSVWQLDHDLAAGTRLASGDVHVAEVAVDAATAVYAATSASVVGRVAAHDLAAGELLPRAALLAKTPAARLVTVPVEPLHLPLGLQRGERVDVWLTSADPSELPGTSRLVLASALVSSVESVDASGRTGVVLAVPDRRVPALVSAVRNGSIDLVGAE